MGEEVHLACWKGSMLFLQDGYEKLCHHYVQPGPGEWPPALQMRTVTPIPGGAETDMITVFALLFRGHPTFQLP